jgi:DNA (cytosine-5)-methyltransferase 1
MNELALFAGAGGGILGGHLLGWRTVCAVEWESYPASVLCARQNDGLLPPFPIWDDVQTFDGKPWRGIVDVVSGGFPCQDISSAGKGVGIDGERSGMWGEMARIICEVRPRFVFVENSPMLTSRGLGRVLGDLASMGFDAKWGVLGAANVGANHQRDRIWIVGKTTNSSSHRSQKQANEFVLESKGSSKLQFEQSRNSSEMAYTSNEGLQGFRQSRGIEKSKGQERQSWTSIIGGSRGWWQSEPNVGRVVNGMASRVDRLKAIGNGQVPLCAATAWRILND